MYKKGGIYLDVKYSGINGFKLLYLTGKEYFCKDIPASGSGIYNAILICKPHNKIMLQCIQQVVKHVETRYYGYRANCIGPLMISSFTKGELDYEYINESQRYLLYHGTRILQCNKNYSKERQDHWTSHWVNRQLYKRNIPSILFQTSKGPPLSYAVKQLKERAIGWDYMHFTDKDILQFFKENPLKDFPRIAEVFHSYEKGEHKADLFRYYFLYVKGGVFIDTDAMLQVDLDEIARDYEFFSVESKYINPKSIFQGLIGSMPKNKIIYEALKDMYHITKETLKDYFIIVKHLYPIVQKYKKDYHLKLYVEKWHVKPSKKTKCESMILEDGTNTPLLMHYPCAGKVPFK
jgi:mannosyltransferase OCH1-like enzyme